MNETVRAAIKKVSPPTRPRSKSGRFLEDTNASQPVEDEPAGRKRVWQSIRRVKRSGGKSNIALVISHYWCVRACVRACVFVGVCMRACMCIFFVFFCLFCFVFLIQSYLGYPKPRLSECSSDRGVCSKEGFLTKIADSATEQCPCVFVSYVHVHCRHTVVRHRVQCEV